MDFHRGIWALIGTAWYPVVSAHGGTAVIIQRFYGDVLAVQLNVARTSIRDVAILN